MKKIVVSVLGYDRPGIIAAVSKILFEQQCNIEDVSQTTLQTEFVGIFIASQPDELSLETLHAKLRESLLPKGLSVIVKPMEKRTEWNPPATSEPFIITTLGSDRLGLVAGMTEVMERFGINITNLRAVFRGSLTPEHNMMIYEVDISAETDQQAFREALYLRAGELGLDISLQHRDIFEMIHSV
ncbi:MAG: glycine cleavage system protein R [Syntrophobacteraceae bacterium]